MVCRPVWPFPHMYGNPTKFWRRKLGEDDSLAEDDLRRSDHGTAGDG